MSTTNSNAAHLSTTPQHDHDSFHTHLQSSTRILALLGAGLSASSGLPTFRGAGGLWRTHDAISLATPEAFSRDPGLVWQFYSYRRHMALSATPNAAHYALAELARRRAGFMALTQNVDGLSQRASHPAGQLQLLHGSLFEVKCTDFYCRHVGADFRDPIVQSLRMAGGEVDLTTNGAGQRDVADPRVELKSVPVEELPRCPECKTGLLRPGVVWFGEALPRKVLDTVEEFIERPEGIDLMLVIGTSASVHPAAAYIGDAKERGARIAVINMDENDALRSDLDGNDWFFKGDAADIVPRLLEPVIGETKVPDGKL